MEEELCLVNSYTRNSILRETKYFYTLTRRFGNVLTIATRCDNSWLQESYYQFSQWYTSNNRGDFTVSRFYSSYPHKF
jgi:hypothetical protein